MSMHVARFTVAYWCILVAVLLPIGCAMLAKRGSFSMNKDNHDPRRWLANQTGWRARANAAQANSYEVLPFFIGAVIIAHQLGAAQTPLDMLALAFVFLRVLYIVMYVGDIPMARSMIWAAGFAVNIGIFFLGYH